MHKIFFRGRSAQLFAWGVLKEKDARRAARGKRPINNQEIRRSGDQEIGGHSAATLA